MYTLKPLQTSYVCKIVCEIFDGPQGHHSGLSQLAYYTRLRINEYDFRISNFILTVNKADPSHIEALRHNDFYPHSTY